MVEANNRCEGGASRERSSQYGIWKPSIERGAGSIDVQRASSGIGLWDFG